MPEKACVEVKRGRRAGAFVLDRRTISPVSLDKSETVARSEGGVLVVVLILNQCLARGARD